MPYKVDKNKFIINDSILEFREEISTVLRKNGKYLILVLGANISQTSKHYQNRNIFGISPEGEVLWQVGAVTQNPDDLYASLFEKENAIKAATRSGVNCWIDCDTGLVMTKISLMRD